MVSRRHTIKSLYPPFSILYMNRVKKSSCKGKHIYKYTHRAVYGRMCSNMRGAICTAVSGWGLHASCNYFLCGSSFSSNISTGTCSYFSVCLMSSLAKYSSSFVLIRAISWCFRWDSGVFLCMNSTVRILEEDSLFCFVKGYTSAVTVFNMSDRDVQFLLLRKWEKLKIKKKSNIAKQSATRVLGRH